MSVREALEAFVPAFPADSGDWDDILRRSGRVSASARRRRRLLLAAALAAALATLLATPAFGIRGLISGLFGRTNVRFTGKTAPLEIKRNFYDLGLEAPPGGSPEAIASQTRRVASFRVGKRTHVLWVAPTRRGGFCWQFSGSLTGCLTNSRQRAGLSLSYDEVVRRGVSRGYPSIVEGSILTSHAASLTIQYADGTRTDVPFYYVSKPIDAGFFYQQLPPGHATWKTRALAAVLRDKAGRVLSRQTFYYETAADRAREKRLEQRMKNQLRKGGRVQPHVIAPPALPPPTAPLQRGAGDGVTAVAGRNGVVVFDTRGAPPAVKKLISLNADYQCFGRLPYNSEPVELGTTRTTAARVSIRLFGLPAPLLGCDVQGEYGHRWPDRLHEHYAVEIPFTAAGRRYFADRAAARDLALFVRSDALHPIRKLGGEALAAALRKRFGSAVERLAAPGSHLPAGRIGYAVTSSGAVYVEHSTTGRRFFVRVAGGRITGQNVTPLAFL